MGLRFPFELFPFGPLPLAKLPTGGPPTKPGVLLPLFPLLFVASEFTVTSE